MAHLKTIMNHPVAEWNLYVVSFYYQWLYQLILPFYLHKTWASYKYLDYLWKKMFRHSLKTFWYIFVILFFSGIRRPWTIFGAEKEQRFICWLAQGLCRCELQTIIWLLPMPQRLVWRILISAPLLHTPW